MPRTVSLYEVTLVNGNHETYHLGSSHRTSRSAIRSAKYFLTVANEEKRAEVALILQSLGRDTDHGLASEYVGFKVYPNEHARPALVKYVEAMGKKLVGPDVRRARRR